VKVGFARHLACLPGHEEAIPVLVRKAVVEARHRGLHVVLASFHQADPLRRAMKGLTKFKYRTELFIDNKTDMELSEESLLETPAYQDFSLA
jgi:hypothetical protein